MKLPIVILAVLGVVCGKSLPTHSLEDDLMEFMALVPTEKALDITLHYLSKDHEVQEFMLYIQSEEFPTIHKIVEYLKEHKECLKFIDDHGVDVYGIIHQIHDFLGLHPFEPTNTTHMGVGMHGFIDDMIAVLPLDDLKAFFHKEMETSLYFEHMVKAIHSPEFVHMVEDMVEIMRTWPEYRKMLESLREKGVDVDHMYELLWTFFGRSSSGTRSLLDELKEFMELIPTHKVLEITMDYLAHDHELREFIVYIQSEEFPMIHKIVEFLKEHTYCFKFFDEHHFDVYAFINEIYEMLGLTPFKPTHTTHRRVGIHGLIDDVIAVHPIHDLKVLFDKEMETSVYFQHLFTAIHTSEFVTMLDTVRAWPEYHKLLEIIREKGVDVDHINELLALFGLPHL